MKTYRLNGLFFKGGRFGLIAGAAAAVFFLCFAFPVPAYADDGASDDPPPDEIIQTGGDELGEDEWTDSGGDVISVSEDGGDSNSEVSTEDDATKGEILTDADQSVPDPQFCPDGFLPSDAECSPSQTKIQNAVNDAAAQAVNGTIYIEAGNFNENPGGLAIQDISTNLTLLGGYDFGLGSGDTIIKSNVTVKNTSGTITFQNIIFDPSVFLFLDNASNVIINLGDGDENFTLPRVIAANASNLTIDGQDGDDAVTIAEDVTLAGGDFTVTAETITVAPGAMISTRNVLDPNQDTSNSTGNSGDIKFTAQTITIGDNAKLYAHTQPLSVYNAGEISLLAQHIVDTPVVIFNAAEARISIGTGVVIKGGDITIKSEAGDEGEADNPAVLDQIISALENWGTDIASLPVSVLYKSADARVEVGDGVQILSSGSVNLEADANASAEAKAIFQYVSFGFSYAGTYAEVNVHSGAQIAAQGDVTIRATATSTAQIIARTQMNLGVFPSDPNSVAFSLAIAWSKVTSRATVSEGAWILSDAGNVNVIATGESETEASAGTGNYDDGRAGISISIELAQGDVQAVVGGSLTAAGAPIADPDSDLTEGVGVQASYVSSDKSSAEGGTGGGPDWGDLMSKGDVSAAKIISALSKAFSENSDKDKTQSNTKTDLSIAGALAFSWVDNRVKTQILGTAVLKSGMDLEILADIVEGVQLASQASVEKPEDSVKDVAISAAIAIGLITHQAEVLVEDGATLDARRDMTIASSVHYPYLTDWDEYWSKIKDPLQSFKDGAANVGNQDAVGNVVNYFDFSLGIQEAFFNSWARSVAQADELGVAGSVNFMSFANAAETTIGENVKINQDAAYQTDAQTVTVAADILIRLINLTGNFEFDFSMDGFLTGDASANPMGSESEKGGVGGSIFILLMNNTARAQIGTGTQIHTGAGGNGFSLNANNDVFNFSFVQSGGKAGQFGVSGMFSLNVLTHVSEALIADGVTIAGGDVSVTANDKTLNINVAGAVVTGGGVGVGAAIAINVFDRTVRAIVGSADIDVIGGASTMDIGGDLTVSATADGAVWSFTAAAALVKEEGKQAETGTTPASSATPELTDTEDPLDGISLPILFGELTPAEQAQQKQEQQTGVAIAGSVSFNVSRDSVVAAINQAGTINVSGAVEVTADNETWMISASGSAAISSAGSTNSAGLAGAFSVATLISDTRAFIAGADITADHLKVSALHGGRIASLTGGLSGAPKQNGAAVAGSISVNIILSDTQAYLENVTAALSDDSSVTAKDETMIISVAGAGAYGGKSGVGVSLAINLIGFSNKLGIVVNRPAVTKAYIKGSTLHLNGGSLDVFAATTLNDITLPRIVAATGSAGISPASASVAGAGMISINIVKNFVEAYIQNSTMDGASDVSVTARDDSWIISVGGAVALGGGTGLGGAIGYNEIATVVRAFLDDVSLTASGALSLVAESRAIIASAAVGVAVSSNSGLAGAGSIAINLIHNVTRAFITNNSQADVAGAVEILAKDVSLLISIAGSVGASSGGSGVGAALSYNLIANDVAAFIMSSKVATDSTLTVSALSSPMMISLALGGAGAQGFSLGGSVTVNSISNLVDAHISGASADRSDIDAAGDVTVSARESASMYVLAGAGAGSASGASVGASLAYNYVGDAFNPANPNIITYQSGLDNTNTMQPVVGGADTTAPSDVTAYISYTDLTTGGNLSVTAGFEPLTTLPSFSDLDDKITLTTTDAAISPAAQITNVTIAGSGADSFAFGGAVSLNFIRSDVSAFLSNSMATVSGNITLLAADVSSIYGGAGSGAGAGTAAVGASVTVNDVRNNIKAYMDNAAVTSTGGAIHLTADEKASVISLALGGAGAGTVSISGSVSVNFIQNVVEAYIANNAVVTAFGDVALSAKDTSMMIVVAGNGGGSGSIAGTIAFAFNSIANTVSAYINAAKVTSQNGNIALAAATQPPALFPAWMTSAVPGLDAQIYAAAVSGAGSGTVSVGASFSLNWIRNTVEARISNIGAAQLVIASNGIISLNASNASSMNSLAGTGAGAGTDAAGVSLAYNFLGGDPADPLATGSNIVRAIIRDSAGLIHAGEIKLNATTSATINNATLAGSGAGTASIGGSISLNRIRSLTEACIVNGANVRASGAGGVSVTAADTSIINAVSGQGNFSGSVALGAALAYNEIYNTVRAYIENSTVNALAGSVIVKAESNASVNTVAAGFAASGAAGVAGSVVVDILQITAEAFIRNSTVVAEHNIAVLAYAANVINSIGGTISGGLAGIGGSAVANVLTNTALAFISGSTALAKGNGGTITIKRWANDAAGTESTETIRGLAVIADSKETVHTYAGTAALAPPSGGVNVGVAANVMSNIVKDTTLAYIENSTVNNLAEQGKSVIVRAHQSANIASGSGSLGVGDLGVAAMADVNVIENVAKAYISGSTVYGALGVEVNALTREYVKSVVVGVGVGTYWGAAGAASVATMANTLEAYIADSTIVSGADLKVLANDRAEIDFYAGTLSGSVAAGTGGAAVVGVIANSASAYLKGANVTTVGGVQVKADSIQDVETWAGAGGAGGVAALNATVAVISIETNASAYIDPGVALSQITSGAGVLVAANNTAKVNDKVGAASLSGGGSFGGAADVILVKNAVNAYIGDNSVVNAAGNIEVLATAFRDIDSTVVSFAASLGTSVNGAVSIISVGSGLTGEQAGVLSETPWQNGVNDTINPSGGLGGFAGDYTSTAASGAINSNLISLHLTADLSAADVAAYVGANASLTSTGGNITVKAEETATIDQTSGAASGGSYSAGGSVAIANIGGNILAGVNFHSVLSAFGDIAAQAQSVHEANVRAYGGTFGLIGSLGAQVAVLKDAGSQIAFLGDNVQITGADEVFIRAEAQRTLLAEAKGAAVGALAAGAALAEVSANGTTRAYLGNWADISGVRNLNLTAWSAITVTANEFAVAAGIGAFQYNQAQADATATVQAYIADNATVSVTGDLAMLAQSIGEINATSNGVSAGGLAVGVSESVASWTGNTLASLGESATLAAGNDVSIQSKTQSVLNAYSTSSSGAFLGGVGAESSATAVNFTTASIGLNSVSAAARDFLLRAESNVQTYAEAVGNSVGLVTIGVVKTKSSVDNSAKTLVCAAAQTTAGRNAEFTAQSIGGAMKSKAIGGSGGLFAGASTSATANYSNTTQVSIGAGATLKANNGSMKIQALADMDAHGWAWIDTGGAVTDNKTESDVKLEANTLVDVLSGADLSADSLYIWAKVARLDADSYAYSKTYAADSTTQADSILKVGSYARITITDAILTGVTRLEVCACQSNVSAESQAVAEIGVGATGTVIANSTDDVVIRSDVDILGATQIHSNSILIEACAPPQEEAYTNIADGVASTVVNTVYKIVNYVISFVERVVERVASWLPWPLNYIVRWIVRTVIDKIITPVWDWVTEILHSDEQENLYGAYNADTSISLNGDIYFGATDAASLIVDASGAIHTTGGVAANLVGSEIVADDIVSNTSANRPVLIVNAHEGAADGDALIHDNGGLKSVFVQNNSLYDLVLHDITPLSESYELSPEVTVVTGDGRNNLNLTYTTDNADLPSVVIENTTAADIWLRGVITNTVGYTSVANSGGDIFSAPGAIVSGANVTLSAPNGFIGQSPAARVNVHLYDNRDGENATLTANADSLYLDLILRATRDLNAAAPINGAELFLSAAGEIDVLASHTQNFIPAPAGQPTTSEVDGVYYVYQLSSSGGNVSLDVARGEMILLNSVSSPANVFLSASGNITGLAAGEDILAGGAVLHAGNGAGTSLDPLRTSVSNLEAQTGAGGLWVNNIGSLAIGGVTSGSAVEITTSDSLVLVGSLASGGAVNLRAGDDVRIESSASVTSPIAVNFYGDYADTDAAGALIEQYGAMNAPSVNFYGADNADTFRIPDGASNWFVDGGLGFDILEFPSPIAVNVFIHGAGTQDGIEGSEAQGLTFDNINELIGSSNADSLAGLDAPSTWTIDALSSYATAALHLDFSSFERLFGGGAADVFAFADGATLAGDMNGGGGSDALDFSASTGGVLADLSSGFAEYLSTHTLVFAGTFTDVENLIGGAGDDTLTGDDLDNLIEGRAGNDTLNGAAGDDQINGGDGDDLLYASSGSDTVDGGAGYDALDFSQANGAVHLFLTAVGTMDGLQGYETQILEAFDNINNFIGSNFADTLAGADSPSLWTIGAAGNSYQTNGNRADFSSFETLVGGGDSDTFALEDGATFDGTLNGGAGMDTLDLSAFTKAVKVDLLAGIAQYAPSGARIVGGSLISIENAIGGAGNDVLIGDGNDNFLDGGAGDDQINGGAGNDQMSGGAGDDILDGGAGDDQMNGGAGDDKINGGLGNDILDGGAGDDQMNGGAGDDQMNGGAGDDKINGGLGNDILDGAAGDDQINGGAGDDQMNGGAGDDKINGGLGNDILDGGDGDDHLYPGWGVDLLIGGNGYDSGYVYRKSVFTIPFADVERLIYLVEGKNHVHRVFLLIIPVNSGQIEGVGCAECYRVGLLLPRGQLAIFTPRLGAFASLTDLQNESRPPLPEGWTYLAGARVGFALNGSSVLLRSFMLSFALFEQPSACSLFAIFYWDETLNDGAGGWVEIPSWRTTDWLTKGLWRLEAGVFKTGDYVFLCR